MTARAENINPSILTWARETSGLSVEAAAARLRLTSSARETAAQKLEALERGERKPTRQQLLKIAETYRRPLTAFYLANPPRAGDCGADFRSSVGTASREETLLLNALIRNIRVRQDMARSILEDDYDTERLAFVGSMPVTISAEEAAGEIRQTLGIGVEQLLEWGRHSPRVLFSSLRAQVEMIGAFVLLVGDLGSHHTRISGRIFRGFAIADEIAPFIVINDQDAESARSFTLMHELAHVFVGSTGVSDAPSISTPATQLARVERFCNDVAGEFLLPSDSLDPISGLAGLDAIANSISSVAVSRSLSEPMVAYRYWRLGRIEKHIYSKLAAKYAARWQAAKKARREDKQANDQSGPSYYTLRKHRLGDALISLVGRMLKANELTHTKAAMMLGVKSSSVEPLLNNVSIVSGSHRIRRA